MRIALAQKNGIIGDFKGNLEHCLQQIAQAEEQKTELLIFSNWPLSGGDAQDLFLRSSFPALQQQALKKMAQACRHVQVLMGDLGQDASGLCYGFYLLGEGQVLQFTPHKPLHGAKASTPAEISVGGRKLAVLNESDLTADSEAEWQKQGVQALVVLADRPFEAGLPAMRLSALQAQASKLQLPIAFCNAVGAQAALCFDGHSSVLDPAGRLIVQAAAFKEDFVSCDLFEEGHLSPIERDPMADIEDALVLGLRDYCQKSGIKRALLGLSGGIDSAVVAALAVKALGAENVTGIALPSRYSSEGSVTDARDLAQNLGMPFYIVPIEGPFAATLAALDPVFAGTNPDVTEENIQARLRAVLLMAYSNKKGGILLTTGNKSEAAVGYCTLYGDTCGAVACIADLYKTEVYALARYINRDRILIPLNTITKAPSAELRPDQLDQDSLPPYPVLDALLKPYLEENASRAELVERGFDPQMVERICHLVDLNEYKRRQAALVLRVSKKAFGSDRAVPLVQRFNA